MDIVELDEVAPMDYRFAIRGRRYRLRFDEGAWVLEQLRNGAQEEVEQSFEVASFGEGVNLALDEGQEDFDWVNVVGSLSRMGGLVAPVNFVPGPPNQRQGARKEER
ncbi:MAG: hypothetical protein ACYC2H_03395 [Thermoplasmatota archaeon]